MKPVARIADTPVDVAAVAMELGCAVVAVGAELAVGQRRSLRTG